MRILPPGGPALARGVLLGAALTLALVRGAAADLIVQSAPFAIAGNTSLIGFQEFDPSLGTLDSVNVQITGAITFSVLAQPQAPVTPIVDFDALRPTGQGFEFAGSGARFIFPTRINPTTAPLPLQFATGFNLAFSATALSDLTGVIVAGTSATGATLVPPVTVVARRDDFIEDLAAIGIQEQFLFLPANVVLTQPVSGSATATLTYAFTPFPVPEPAAAALFALGLAGLGLLRRRDPA